MSYVETKFGNECLNYRPGLCADVILCNSTSYC